MKLSLMQKMLLGLLVGGTVIYLVSMAFGNKGVDKQTLSPTVTPTVTVISTVVATATPISTPTPIVTVPDKDALYNLVLVKSKIPKAKFQFSIGANDGSIAKGSVKNSDDINGAAWFAGKINGAWSVSYIGQGVPQCAEIAGINYPTTWISHCMQGKTTVQR